MYLARFSYDVLPANRQNAIGFIRREAEAARAAGLSLKCFSLLKKRSIRFRDR